eukprot:scaffold77074_cov20-Tisochrysis_lutea.AAC.2
MGTAALVLTKGLHDSQLEIRGHAHTATSLLAATCPHRQRTAVREFKPNGHTSDTIQDEPLIGIRNGQVTVALWVGRASSPPALHRWPHLRAGQDTSREKLGVRNTTQAQAFFDSFPFPNARSQTWLAQSFLSHSFSLEDCGLHRWLSKTSAEEPLSSILKGSTGRNARLNMIL